MGAIGSGTTTILNINRHRGGKPPRGKKATRKLQAVQLDGGAQRVCVKYFTHLAHAAPSCTSNKIHIHHGAGCPHRGRSQKCPTNNNKSRKAACYDFCTLGLADTPGQVLHNDNKTSRRLRRRSGGRAAERRLRRRRSGYCQPHTDESSATPPQRRLRRRATATPSQ